MNLENGIRLSLELHLFFDRIMKEHSFFIEASFTEKDKQLKNIARRFQNEFANILRETIRLANLNVTKSFLDSGEMVTPMTLEAEKKSSELTGILIDTNLTQAELNLESGTINNQNERLSESIHQLNKKTILLVQDLINFKQDILNNVLDCKMFTTNYPLLISHLLEEAKVYLTLLKKLEKGESYTNNYLYKQEIFWDNIMKEHAWFIRGLLDPSEKQLIKVSNQFANNYEDILRQFGNNLISLTNASLKETTSLKNFKVTGENGILRCQIKSIILPLLADHVTREANHFIRLLRNFNINLK